MNDVLTLDDLDLDGAKVLVRSDVIDPLDGGQIGYDFSLRHAGATGILCSHLRRRKGLDPASSPEIHAARLAKRMEEVRLPGQPDPIRIPRDAEALCLLQQIRDDAHRFGITCHRSLRSKSMVGAILDDVPGIGPHGRRHSSCTLGF